MSNFMSKGLRQVKLAEQKKTKAHVKAFYKILGDMNTLADNLDSSIEYTEDNINEYVKPMYGRELDNMEKIVLLGKLQYAKEKAPNKPI